MHSTGGEPPGIGWRAGAAVVGVMLARFFPRSTVMAVSFALLALLTLPAVSAQEAPLPPEEPVADPTARPDTLGICDGIVRAVTQIGERIYLGGTFTKVGTDCSDPATIVTSRYLV